jgi:flagellar motor switch protein FliM
MAQTEQASVIRRKTRAAREGADPRVMSPVRALRLALARAADTLCELPLVVATVEQRRVEAGEVEAALGGAGLFVLLDGAAGVRAAMRLCPAFTAALVEVQTTGRIRPGEPRPRPPTGTDAALVAPLVDALMAGFDDGMGGGAQAAPRGLHFGDRVEDARALALLLTAPEFDFFRLTADLGPGLRTGRIDLLLPPAPGPAPPPGTPQPGGARRGAGRGAASVPGDILSVALPAPVTLDAVLARIRLPLGAAMALAPGQRLPVPGGSLRHGRRTRRAGAPIAAGPPTGRGPARDGRRKDPGPGTRRRPQPTRRPRPRCPSPGREPRAKARPLVGGGAGGVGGGRCGPGSGGGCAGCGRAARHRGVSRARRRGPWSGAVPVGWAEGVAARAPAGAVPGAAVLPVTGVVPCGRGRLHMCPFSIALVSGCAARAGSRTRASAGSPVGGGAGGVGGGRCGPGSGPGKKV